MTTTPYEHSEGLRAHFKACIDTALDELDLTLEEADWLRRLADEASLPDSMRIEAQLNAQPLASGALLIHQRNPELQAVYLYSPLLGVRGFNTIKNLESNLQSQLAHLGVPTEPLQFVELDGAVFERWADHLLEQQVDLLDGLSATLAGLPSLRSVAKAALAGPFAELLAGIEDPASQRVQIVAKEQVVHTRSLCDLVMAEFSAEPLGLGMTRRFVQGAAPGDSAFNTSCEQALKASAAAVSGQFAQDLRTYWSTGDSDADGELTRSQRLALALANNYARALVQAVAAERVSQAQLEWLRGLLMPGEAETSLTINLMGLTLAPAASEDFIPLADCLLLTSSATPSDEVFVFCSRTGLSRFTDQASVEQHYRAMLTHADRPASISQQDWEALQQQLPKALHLRPVPQGAVPGLAQSLMDLVNRRLEYALRFPGAQSSTAGAVVEDALDIRALIDRRLACVGNSARWLRKPSDSGEAGLPLLPSQWSTLAERLSCTQALVALISRLKSCQPSIWACAEDLLATFAAVISEGQLAPDGVFIQRAGKSQSLIDYFMDRLCSQHADATEPALQLCDQAGQALGWSAGRIARQQINDLTLDFSAFYLQKYKAFDSGPLRLGGGVYFIPEVVQTLHDAMLRLEASKAGDEKVLPSSLLGLLQQALDLPDRPPVDTRQQIHGLSLKIPGKAGVLAVTDTFVLQQAAPDHGPILLSSPLEPLTSFADEQTLRTQMDGAMQDPEKLYRWLDLIHAEDLLKWHSPSVLPGVSEPNVGMTAASGPLLAHLVASTTNYRENTRRYYLTYALRCEFNAVLLEHFVDTIAAQYPLQKPLTRLHHDAQNSYFRSLLPAWLNSASSGQVALYAELIQASAQVSNAKFNYLFDVPTLADFAYQKLSEALPTEYPEAPSDPRSITITLKHYTPNPVLPGQSPSPSAADVTTTTKSLIDFALTHADVLNAISTMSVTAAWPDQTTTTLDAGKIRSLVDKLDVGSAFRTLLSSKLSADGTDYAERRRRYGMVAKPYLMEEAYQYLLEHKLTEPALRYLARILNQPDALARAPLDGMTISIDQFQLQAAQNFAPDTVRDLYLIGPTQENAGPLLLFSAHHPDPLFREYSNLAALRAAMLIDTQLQAEILEGLDLAEQIRYGHKGLLHPHLFWSSADIFDTSPPADVVQLVRGTLAGNALHHLFERQVATLIELAKARTVTAAEVRWNRFVYLLRLVGEQFLFFAPGKLAKLVNALQSAQYLKASAEAALRHNWGESLAELVTALAGLAASRSPGGGVSRKAPEPAATQPELPTDLATLPTLQQRLGSLAAETIQLNNLTPDPALGLYLDTQTDRYFAPVAGNVYEVARAQGVWHIIKGSLRGPEITRVDGHWQVDLKPGLRGGSVFSCFDTTAADVDIEERFTTLASGMPEIARLHPHKHAQLKRALRQARSYLETSLENLDKATPQSALPPATQRTLDTTFDSLTSAHTVGVLRDYLKRILQELLSTSMNPDTSKRIVIGMNMPEYDNTLAFVYNGDPRKRIFITEQLFTLSREHELYTTVGRDELLAHQQAVSLIHEISHQKLKTVDVAYLRASSPYPDQFNSSTPAGARAREETRSWQRDGLSTTTDDQTLFKTFDNGAWRDLMREDGRQLETILRLSGETDLTAARKAFREDAQIRTDIILANADSLALLICTLGRIRFAPAG